MIDKSGAFDYNLIMDTLSFIKINDKSKNKGERKMSNKNLIVNTPEPKPGILERGDLFAIAVGMVIGSGMVTLIGPAMAMTGYSV